MDLDTVTTVLWGLATFIPPPFNFIVIGVAAIGGGYAAYKKRVPTPPPAPPTDGFHL